MGPHLLGPRAFVLPAVYPWSAGSPSASKDAILYAFAADVDAKTAATMSGLSDTTCWRHYRFLRRALCLVVDGWEGFHRESHPPSSSLLIQLSCEGGVVRAAPVIEGSPPPSCGVEYLSFQAGTGLVPRRGSRSGGDAQRIADFIRTFRLRLASKREIAMTEYARFLAETQWRLSTPRHAERVRDLQAGLAAMKRAGYSGPPRR